MVGVTVVVIKGPGGSIFACWCLGFAPGITILVIRGSPGTPKMRPRDPFGFSLIFDGFGGFSWDPFWIN